MSQNTTEKGQQAESLAITFLTQQGLQLVERNVKYRFGEIDVIMRQGKTWVFIEVKFRTQTQYGGAIHALSAAQIKRLRAAASHYIQKHQINAACRFDVIAIEPTGINWIKDAF